MSIVLNQFKNEKDKNSSKYYELEASVQLKSQELKAKLYNFLLNYEGKLFKAKKEETKSEMYYFGDSSRCLEMNKTYQCEIKDLVQEEFFPQYFLKLKLSKEIPIKSNKNKSTHKFIRERERVSRITKDGNWRFDLTKVNKHIGNFVQPFYEIELEFIGKNRKNVESIYEYFYWITFFILHVDFRGLAPQPVTLEKNNLFNIRRGYSVTAKVDGERRMIAFGFGSLEDGFLFNQNEIVECKIKNKAKGLTVIDGEYLEKEKLFLGFDILYYNGKDVRSKSLIERHQFLNDAVSEISKSDIKIEIKRFILFEDNKFKTICEASKNIYNNQKKKFELDGLIFTPLDSRYGNRNKRTYKWKPIELQTIDFLVKDILGEYFLFVTSKEGMDQWANSETFNWVDNSKTSLYPYLFSQTPIDKFFSNVKNNKNKNKKLDNKIIECFYDTNDNLWKFLRERDDKTAVYLRGKNEGVFEGPNFYTTAVSTYKSIKEPITEDEIFNTFCQGNSQNNAYYKNVKKSEMVQMRKFHNEIKTIMYTKYVKKGDNVLEIGAGRGGDIYKLKKRGANYVLMVDIDQPGLNEAKERNKKLKSETKINTMLGNARTDLTKEISNKMKNNNIESFNVVSIQFAIHYFFETAKIFQLFFKNIDKYLKKGGYVLVTTLDGESVKKLLEKKNEHKFGSIFEIQKKYDSKKLSKDKKFGHKIDVIGETFGKQSEYLVFFETITQKFKDNGYDMVQTGLFGETQTIKKYFTKMGNDEKSYSVLNRYIIFKKI